MQALRKSVALSVVSLLLFSGVAFAQYDHHNDHGRGPDHYVRHNDWHHGGHINHGDWNRGRRIDYHRYHLNAPPRGYQWREVDGNYVLASIASGIIASAIVASAAGH